MLMGLERHLVVPELNQMYFGIHIEGIARKRKFYGNIVFDDPVAAQLFFDMEIFAVPEHTLPERYKITEVFHWEIEEKELKYYKFPVSVKLMFGDSFFYNSMLVTLQIQARKFPDIFYASSWCIVGNSDFSESEEIQESDTQVFGVRLRPGYSAPNRRKFISMRGEGLPGLWYITIGAKKEVEVFPFFDEDEVNPCLICPNRPIPRRISND